MSFFILSVRAVLVLTLVFNSSVVFAHDKNPPSNNEVKNLLDQFHHEIEHGEHDETKSKVVSVLSQWVDNFNLARISMDTHRWTQMKYYQDSGKSEYIRNFPVLASFYFLSHTLEVFSGPLGVYVASDLGLGSAAKVAIGAVGAIISIPGLDPLCILLFAVSPLKPMQKMFSGIRMVAVKVSGGVVNQFGLKKAAQRIFENKDRLVEIVKNNSENLTYDVSKDSLQRRVTLKSSEGKNYLVLNFKSGAIQNGSVKTWVESLEVLDTELLKQNQKTVDQVLKQFNLSARYALRQAILKPRKTFYTDAVETASHGTNIQFKDYAVVVKPQIRLKTSIQNEKALCQGLFQ